MYTVSILANRTLARREFRDVLDCVDYVWIILNHELDPCKVWSAIHSGPGLCMHIEGAFVSIARLH